jgi:hypothetical protein
VFLTDFIGLPMHIFLVLLRAVMENADIALRLRRSIVQVAVRLLRSMVITASVLPVMVLRIG